MFFVVAIMNGRHVIFAALLLLVPLFAAAQTVQSQQYATTTLTTIVTSSGVSTVAAGTQVLTTTQGQVSLIFSAPVTIPGTHGVCGVYFVQEFNGTAGEVLIGSVTSNSRVDVYVMTASAFKTWSHQIVAGGICTPANLVASQLATTSYNFTSTIPSNGVYEIVVNNLSHSTVTAQVNANLATTAPGLVTVVASSTLTQQMVQTLMQTSTQTIQTVQSSGGPDLTTLAVGIIVVIVIVGIGYVVLTKRRRTGEK